MNEQVAPNAAATPEHPWPVSVMSQKVREWIERLGTVWVEGEITQWSVSGGNVYGKLKDLTEDATISINVWSSVRGKIPADLKQGDRVVALVKPNYWVKGGTLSMQVFDMRHVGLGDLLERLERLREQLASEGLFAPERKQKLPFLPQCIGLITGKDSDAEKDVLQNAKLRWPDVEFRVIHTLVQGDKAAPEVIAAIKTLDEDPSVDVIIIARGGGSFLDLMVFSDEALVRAAANAKTPIVSAIGHENDRPVLDDVGDLRASTPTDAAKRVVPDVVDERHKLDQLRQRLFMRVDTFVENQLSMIEQIRSRPILANPYTFIEVHEADVERALEHMRLRLDQLLSRESMQIGHLRQQVRSLSPQSTLDRGYSVVRDLAGHVISDSDKVKTGQQLKIRLAKGELGAVAE